jgi:hypothetical protein
MNKSSNEGIDSATGMKTKPRRRGRPPETWKHETYALILRTLSSAPGQVPEEMVANFADGFFDILYGDPAPPAACPWDDGLGADRRRGMVEEARRRQASEDTISRMEQDVRSMENNFPRAMLLLERLVVRRCRREIRWSRAERKGWPSGCLPIPRAPTNEPRRQCICGSCRPASQTTGLSAVLACAASAGVPLRGLHRKAWSDQCLRGGPGLATWERGAWRVACVLLGDEHAPKTFKVMSLKAQAHC